MQQRLLDIGNWLRINGEAVYGTRVWTDRPAASESQNVFFTSKNNDLYLICTQWPEKNIFVPGLKKAGKVSLLGSNVPVNTRFSGGTLSISPPVINPSNIPCEYAWIFKISDIK